MTYFAIFTKFVASPQKMPYSIMLITKITNLGHKLYALPKHSFDLQTYTHLPVHF